MRGMVLIIDYGLRNREVIRGNFKGVAMPKDTEKFIGKENDRALLLVIGTGFNTRPGLAHGYVWVWVQVQHLVPVPNPYP